MLELLRLQDLLVYDNVSKVSFNPYCVGIIALTLEITCIAHYGNEFQSLLCWNYCAYGVVCLVLGI